ncbi:conserved Plasmodium protein, unknown function [Plasmodium sp. gorilla clade G2]|uniref:conserved Plasmodium protein, unknown function n=1 Tax=Plasmodium sp. gorilla clade G2 TaxID=880535 RepID=UPI000D2175DE|nr:conserved Plasmodium protein, unknown function [Plasmodium sp. gorilla clade G2]SOV16876.1 conserved Plasmodium protein, unknown function [Plasmodium sp. gorilla clade G2]
MDMGVENLLNQLNELESKNRLIHIEIEELKITQNELNKKEKELIVDIENICTNLKLMEKENIQLNNDIDRVNLICKNVETTLHNEFVKVEIAEQKNNLSEYNEDKDKERNVNDDLIESLDMIKNIMLNMEDSDEELNKLNEIKNKNYLLNQISIEDLYEIYEDTKEKYQANSFKNQCAKIAIVDYKTHTYFCNPMHLLHMINLLVEKIRINKNDPNFNFVTMSNFYGVNEKEDKEKKMENFGLSELNKIMINHYKSKKINVDK